ncbi:hypothetical protein SmJEL517_g02445 [Synchytrium microbalum]|uniref:Uncharacterized protein n=1 Tax=Synchytrium microbalum TaxID=1806994 RepID=A0A507CAK4_9FUNG|nr:uncharacterized protein SmJEL517_g02445 [Synchytrium microbalum]TPX35024.1 hypothetical protein SmJEL517_g02445 [Synchytrium microbalum]
MASKQKPLKLRPANVSLPWMFGIGQMSSDDEEDVIKASSPPAGKQGNLAEIDEFVVHTPLRDGPSGYSQPLWEQRIEETFVQEGWSPTRTDTGLVGTSTPDRSNSNERRLHSPEDPIGNWSSPRMQSPANGSNSNSRTMDNARSPAENPFLTSASRSNAETYTTNNTRDPFATSSRLTRSPPPPSRPQTANATPQKPQQPTQQQPIQRPATALPTTTANRVPATVTHIEPQPHIPPLVITGMTPGSTRSVSPRVPDQQATPVSPQKSVAQTSAILDKSSMQMSYGEIKAENDRIYEVQLLREELRAALNEARRWRDIAESAGASAAAARSDSVSREAVENLKNECSESRQRIAFLESQNEDLLNAIYDYQNREQQAHSQLRQVMDRLDEATLKAEEGQQRLADEKAKNERNEIDFRLFSRKLRGLQDTNAELRQEGEQLRSELRRLQYEATGPRRSREEGVSLNESQLAFDNEALKLLVMDLQKENESLKPASQRPDTATLLPSTYNYLDRPPSASADRYRSPIRTVPPSSFDAVRSRLTTAQSSIQPSTNTNDPMSFGSRLARFEQESVYNPITHDTTPPPTRQSNGNHATSNNWASSSLSNARDWGRASWAGPLPLSGNGLSNGGGSNNSRPATSGGPSYRDSENLGEMDFIQVRDQLDAELRKLNTHKASLEYEASRLKSGPGSARKRREDLDDQLENVQRDISSVRMKMRTLKIL